MYLKTKTPKTKPKTIHQKELSYPKKVFQWPWSQHGPANFKPRPYTYRLNESVATKRPAYRQSQYNSKVVNIPEQCSRSRALEDGQDKTGQNKNKGRKKEKTKQ